MTSCRRSASPRPWPAWLAMLALLTAALAGAAGAQDPTLQGPLEPIGTEDVAALRAALGDAATLDPAARTRATEALDEALASIAQREQWLAERATLAAELDGVAERVAALRAAAPDGESGELGDLRTVAAFDAAQATAESRRAEQVALAQRLAKEEQDREAERPELRDRIETLRARLAEAEAALAAPGAATDPEPVAAALAARQRARVGALAAQLALLELRQDGYEALQELTRARRDAARAAAERAAQRLERIREAGRQSRLQQVSRTIRSAGEATRTAPGTLLPIAEGNLERARELETIVTARAQIARERQRFEARRVELDEELQLARARVDLVGLTRAVGLELRSLRRQQFGEITALQRTERDVRARLATAYERRFQLEDEAEDLEDLDRATAELLARLTRPAEVAVGDIPRDALRELLAQRAAIVATLVAEQRGLTAELVDADTALQRLQRATDEAMDFVNERVLWIPDAAPVWRADPAEATLGIRATVDALAAAVIELPAAALEHPQITLGSAVLLALVVLPRRRLRRTLGADADAAARRSTVTMAPTWRSIAVSVWLALPLPVALAAAASIASARADIGFAAPAAALAAALWAAAGMAATVTFATVVLRPRGLAVQHFGWSPARCVHLRRGLRWFAPLLVVAAVTAASDDRLREEVQSEAAARLVLLVAAVGALTFAWRHLHPRLPALRSDVASRMSRQLAIWLFVAALASSAAIGVLVALGYVYSAVALSGRIHASVVLLLLGGVAHATIERWIRLSRRNLAMQRLLSPRKAAAGVEGTVAEPDLAEVDQQTRSLLRAATAVVLVAGVWAIWRDVLPALGILGEFHLWSERVEIQEAVDGGDGAVVTREVLRPITLENVVLALVALVATWIVARNVGGLLEIAVLRRLDMHAGERYAVTTITRYVLGAIGALYAFATLGVGWSSVQWLVAAVSVGLGFGLQEIFANFVSGLILLLERPVRVGDYVTVGGIDGRVQRIQMRATTIVDWDRKELVVPNREFITSHFMNWSLSNQIIRLLVPVGIAYGSDTVRARELMVEAARKCPAILGSPAPTVVFSGFGDNALQLELRVFIASMDTWLDGMNQIHDAVKEALEAAGIEIAFPQRDLHLRSVDPALYGAALSLEPRSRPAPTPPPSQP